MIVQKDFLSKLKDFGINSYEAKIWTALLSRGVSTAGELSDIANVPRSRSYDVLESLEKKGFVIMKIGKPIKYIAVPPKEVLERVKKNVKDEAEKSVSMLEELKDSDVLNDLVKLHTNGVELIDPTDLSGSIKGRDNLYDQLITMIKEAEDSIVLVSTEDGLKRKADVLIKHLKKAKERGVTIRISAPIKKETEDIKELRKIAEIKDLGISARFCIVDDESVMFMMANDSDIHPSYDIGIWLNTKFFASALLQMFNTIWNVIKVKN
ncbi:MAG: helix-turn-helix domain-containing protein [Candidatus Woesearchaeota archaeon]